MLLTKRERMPGERTVGLYGTSVAIVADDFWGVPVERASLITVVVGFARGVIPLVVLPWGLQRRQILIDTVDSCVRRGVGLRCIRSVERLANATAVGIMSGHDGLESVLARGIHEQFAPIAIAIDIVIAGVIGLPDFDCGIGKHITASIEHLT